MALGEEAALQVCPASRLTRHEQFFRRPGLWSGRDRTSLPRRVPGLVRHTERRQALSNAVPLVVVPLDQLPVVPPGAAFIDWQSQPACVIRHGWLAQAKSPSGFGSAD